MPPDNRDLTGARWSSAVICPRWCVYGAQGAPTRERTEEEMLMLTRGQAWGKIVVDGVITGFAEQGRRPRREETISWPRQNPVGTGHADCYIPHEREVVEVVSNAGGTLPPHKAVQVAGYALNHPHAVSAVVDSVDTHTGVEHLYPIVLDELEPHVRRIEEQVVAGLAGELPERVCKTPWDGPAQWCPHVGHCFEGWEPTPLDELLVTIDEVDLLKRLADAEDAASAAAKEEKRLKAERNEIRAEVAKLIEPNVAYEAGDLVQLKRTVYPVQNFALGAAEASGEKLPRRLEPFVSVSQAERWTVKRRPEEDASSSSPSPDGRSTTPTSTTPNEGDAP